MGTFHSFVLTSNLTFFASGSSSPGFWARFASFAWPGLAGRLCSTLRGEGTILLVCIPCRVCATCFDQYIFIYSFWKDVGSHELAGWFKARGFGTLAYLACKDGRDLLAKGFLSIIEIQLLSDSWVLSVHCSNIIIPYTSRLKSKPYILPSLPISWITFFPHRHTSPNRVLIQLVHSMPKTPMCRNDTVP